MKVWERFHAAGTDGGQRVGALSSGVVQFQCGSDPTGLKVQVRASVLMAALPNRYGKHVVRLTCAAAEA